MSAGTGVTHSEFNPSRSEPLHFLQIWIRPRANGLKPSYTEWHPSSDADASAKALVISPDGREGSATIAQDADVYRVRLEAGGEISHDLAAGRGAWFQLISGEVSVGGVRLKAGDAISTEVAGQIPFSAHQHSEGLLFDLN
jgi:redox-sensitive bicupin YhaK (pirin superfamily)